MIDSERLHRAAEVVATQDEPEDGGFAPDALDRFLDESTFLRELTGGTNEIGIHRGSLAYGIGIGVEAARLETSEAEETADLDAFLDSISERVRRLRPGQRLTIDRKPHDDVGYRVRWERDPEGEGGTQS